jgi:FkbH-like protein
MTISSTPELRDAVRNPLLGDLPVEILQKLSKRLKRTDEIHTVAPMKLRVAIHGGFTTSFLSEILPLFLVQRGIDACIREAHYGAFQTDILDDSSPFWGFDPGITFLLPTYRDLHHFPSFDADAETINRAIEAELSTWRLIWRKLKSPIVQLTFTPPATRILGEADGLFPGGRLHYVREVNRVLAREAPAHVTLVDGESLMGQLGHDWHDERLYRIAKQPFSMDATPIIANALAASAAGALGLSRKVLILDLDNTLWGGVIGDDGLKGISLGSETAEGESFVAFQQYIKALSERGIVLCICSKNDPEIAREPFHRHSAMVLTLENIADFRANFDDKASNIRAIAKTLNLGLDSFVFVDDSSVECELVRQSLPQVWTIELAGDPSGFPELVERAIPFPMSRLTNEDVTRAKSYQSLGTVRAGIEDATDIDTFLKELEPVAMVESIRDDTIERISQLIGKTNQFKLNSTIYSPSEIRERAEHVLAVRLKDRLQDYGIVAVAVTEPDDENNSLVICNWVMSCRVFSRRLEFLTLELLAKRAASAGLSRIRLNYEKSNRNGLLAELLPKLGFQNIKDADWFQTDTQLTENVPAHFISCDIPQSKTTS